MSDKDSLKTADQATSQAEASAAEPTLGKPGKRRRTAKVDVTLAEAQDVARAGILEITTEAAIGPVHHLRGEEERLTTHLFECTLPGYRGWFWFATLSRAPRSKQATICEVGLIPGDDALLAPEWVPWSERLKHVTEADLEQLDDTEELAEELKEIRAARSAEKANEQRENADESDDSAKESEDSTEQTEEPAE